MSETRKLTLLERSDILMQALVDNHPLLALNRGLACDEYGNVCLPPEDNRLEREIRKSLDEFGAAVGLKAPHDQH